jgi:hypothetical protein
MTEQRRMGTEILGQLSFTVAQWIVRNPAPRAAKTCVALGKWSEKIKTIHGKFFGKARNGGFLAVDKLSIVALIPIWHRTCKKPQRVKN